MILTEINLKLSYNSGDNNLISEFYTPCFRSSVRYDRAVGFFTSEILVRLSRGLTEFLLNDGSMRLICSPRLNIADIEAIEKGYRQREEVVQDAVLREIEGIPKNIMYDNLNCLSWMIASNRLDIKIAVKRQPFFPPNDNYSFRF